MRERSDIFFSSFEAEGVFQCSIKIVFLCQEFLLNLFTLKSTDESIAQGLAEVSTELTELTCGRQNVICSNEKCNYNNTQDGRTQTV